MAAPTKLLAADADEVSATFASLFSSNAQAHQAFSTPGRRFSSSLCGR
ncbi:PE family protein [Mycobacterium lepromatosis]